MKKRSLTIVVLVIVGMILTVIVVDFLNNRPDRRGRIPMPWKWISTGRWMRI